MAKTVPKTKAGKQRKVDQVMREQKRGELRSSSGAPVTSNEQALAIALAAVGQSRRKKGKTQ